MVLGKKWSDRSWRGTCSCYPANNGRPLGWMLSDGAGWRTMHSDRSKCFVYWAKGMIKLDAERTNVAV